EEGVQTAGSLRNFQFNMAGTVSPDLGTLSILPREVRDRIYSFLLNLRLNSLPKPKFSGRFPARRRTARLPHGAALLRVSKQIHLEASKILYQINDFTFWIDYDISDRNNKSMMGTRGWEFNIGFNEEERIEYEVAHADLFMRNIPYESLRFIRYLNLEIATTEGVRESDIVPVSKTLMGPERPAFKALPEVLEKVCTILRGCLQLHDLSITIRSGEKRPKSIRSLLAPLLQLRDIRKVQINVYHAKAEMGYTWYLNLEYATYLEKVLMLAEGVKTPKYEIEGREMLGRDEDFFHMVGGKLFEEPESPDLEEPEPPAVQWNGPSTETGEGWEVDVQESEGKIDSEDEDPEDDEVENYLDISLS
ncbi:hypothetical protein B7494_g8522, partial [Chlorociboria aeruginascens]